MNLIIDIGNTQAKLYISDCQEITSIAVIPELTSEVLAPLLQRYAPINSIVASTRGYDSALDAYLSGKMSYHTWFDPATTPTPIRNLYQTPETLGADRLAAAVGALPYVEKEGKEALVFDFGTALTIDRISLRGEFTGGNISLGYSARLLALHNLTAKLPMLQPDDEHKPNQFGSTTKSAILNGVYNSIVYEIEGYCEKNPEKIKIFTGGEAFYFANNSKYAIFADYELVPKGLNRILEYNAK